MADPTPALKERAGVINALLDGVQTVLARAPGLEPRDHDGRFALYPSYSHQYRDRYSPRYERYYHVSRAKPDEGIPVRGVARVVAEHTLVPEALPELAPHYVYSADGLRDKYDFDDGRVRLLVVRVERLDEPRLLTERSAYRGCRTWIDLDAGIDLGPSTPVLDDAAFAERRAAIHDALGADHDSDAATPHEAK